MGGGAMGAIAPRPNYSFFSSVCKHVLPIRVSVYQQKLLSLKLKRLPLLSTEDDCVCSLCLCME